MADIFISYAREDREWVEKLAKAYTDNGYSVWWDWDLLVGKRYRETIETELQTCKATVVVWSEHSIRSDFVRDEAEEGQQRNILVPLLKDNVRPPAGFRQLQTADLTKWNGTSDHVEFQRMMRGLQHVVAGAPPVEKGDEPASAPTPAPVAPVASATTVAEEVTSTPASPAPTPVAPQPVVQAKAPEPKPPMGTPPPPATPVTMPAGASTAPLPSPLAAMKVPPSSHPIWRYVAIGAVVFIGLIYFVGQLVPSTTPSSKPSTVAGAPTTPTAPATPAANGGSTQNGGQTAAPPATHPPTLGTKPTDMSAANATVAPVLQKAEQADVDARTQANAGIAAEKAAAAGTASDANGMALGSMTLTDGTYGGQIYNGAPQGVGALSFKNGDLYSGQFDEGKISGRGVVTFSNKTNGYGYSGQFAAGNFNGFGVYYFSNGWRLEGTFKDGQFTGLGAKIDPNGKIAEQGTYENGTLKP